MKLRTGIILCSVFVSWYTWLAVGSIILLRMPADKLVKVTGVVDTATVAIMSHSGRRDHYGLRIFLQDNQHTHEYFRLTDDYGNNPLRSSINRGDTAIIYIRPKWLVPLTLEHYNDIQQLFVNRKEVLSFEEVKRTNKVSLAFWITFIALFTPMIILAIRSAKRMATSKWKHYFTIVFFICVVCALK